MSSLKLYYSLMSQPSRALYLFFKVAEIPFDGKVIDLFKAQHCTEEFQAINPLQKIPVIDHDGFILTESVAILRYICRTYNVADHWYPRDSVKQALVDEYLEWQHSNTRADCAFYCLYKVFWPMFSGKQANDTRIAQLERRMNQTLDSIESFWLQDNLFLCGNEISIADIIGICEIEYTRIAGFDAFAGRPKLYKWKTRIASYLNPYYDETNEVIETIAAKYIKKYGVLKCNF
ncbi:Thioredoxin-like fold,Glutathione S-transferase, N-terminal,Glutathione S-transferase, C-terminal- [Cinara cedri]|uniref:glutathione transferase n=1 Tax=Cinara cedri TaxID=506608 RepID=A0A5E4LXP5_9HEMI|nr:Thioredoxin-like fold,Glutathione S-transferase, N-terminal,Glutathione S-transferase, C-terminal- [Cinara cedri]